MQQNSDEIEAEAQAESNRIQAEKEEKWCLKETAYKASKLGGILGKPQAEKKWEIQGRY